MALSPPFHTSVTAACVPQILQEIVQNARLSCPRGELPQCMRSSRRSCATCILTAAYLPYKRPLHLCGTRLAFTGCSSRRFGPPFEETPRSLGSWRNQSRGAWLHGWTCISTAPSQQLERSSRQGPPLSATLPLTCGLPANQKAFGDERPPKGQSQGKDSFCPAQADQSGNPGRLDCTRAPVCAGAAAGQHGGRLDPGGLAPGRPRHRCSPARCGWVLPIPAATSEGGPHSAHHRSRGPLGSHARARFEASPACGATSGASFRIFPLPCKSSRTLAGRSAVISQLDT